ncbi:MAG: PadR family transcriptional regulator [Gemmatimonadetes bacterium]|nr:PadR family transcriptional regulator [Gemmatimonadota bacterium]
MGTVRAGNLYGTLELLILRALELFGPLHGVGVADHIASRSAGLFRVEEGSLYPALHRLQAKGYVDWEWRKTEEGKRAKFYEITRKGRRALSRELESWTASTRAMLSLLEVSMEGVK